MSKLLVVDNGNLRSADDVQLTEEVLKLKNDNNHWGAIDLLLKAWAKTAPDDVDALHISIRDYKEVLIDKKFGQTKDGKQFDRRFQLTFPRRLLRLIRTVYKPTELTFDKEFFKEFLKRYPYFRVAEKD